MPDKLCTPEVDGKCSRACPHFHYEEMPGWPSAQACFVWDEKLDGEEPYYLTNNVCKPAMRLPSHRPASQLDLPGME